MTRILHFADLHLDRSFATLGMASSEAAKRREELRAALRRIVDMALELEADALTCGGDLYEHERATADTGNFIVAQFAQLAPRPVLIAPGNHDPHLPDSLYRRLQWPDNVHIFPGPSWEPHPVGDITVWGAGHTGPALRDNLLATLRADGPGTNIALFHGSDLSSVPEGKVAHCPFQPEDIERARVAFALLGHYHQLRLRPEGSPRYGYPGSPEPLGFGEEGAHHVLLLEERAGAVQVRPLPVNEVEYQTRTVDVTGMNSSDGVREAIATLAGGGPPAITRVLLTGQPEPEVELDAQALYAACAQRFRYLDIVDRTDLPFDIEQAREESTTRGAFVRLVEERLRTAEGEERDILEQALRYGMRAFAAQEVRPQ